MASGTIQAVRYAIPGTTLTGNSNQIVLIPAVITGGGKSLLAEFGIGLDLSYVNNVTLETFKCGFRTPTGGYIIEDNHDWVGDTNKESMSIVINKITNGISMRIVYLNNLYTTNNVPIIGVVTGQNLKMKFS